MPLLARMVGLPLSVDVRRGAVETLGALLADRRISAEGRVPNPRVERISSNV